MISLKIFSKNFDRDPLCLKEFRLIWLVDIASIAMDHGQSFTIDSFNTTVYLETELNIVILKVGFPLWDAKLHCYNLFDWIAWK